MPVYAHTLWLAPVAFSMGYPGWAIAYASIGLVFSLIDHLFEL